jgi:hypothetical protein
VGKKRTWLSLYLSSSRIFSGEKLAAGHSGDLLVEKFSDAEKPDHAARFADGMITPGQKAQRGVFHLSGSPGYP